MNKPLGENVCILVDSLSHGGAERMAANLSKVLANQNHKVLVVCFRDGVSYEFSGILINLGLDEFKLKQLKQIQKIFRLKRTLEKYKPEVIIDFRTRNRWFMEYVLYQFILKRFKVIYTIHSYKLDYHIPKGNFFKTVYNNSQIVCVSKAIKHHIEHTYSFQNINYIPNAIDLVAITKKSILEDFEEDFIIAVGRLNNEIKQFDKLIESYAQSNLISKKIKLYILGEGKDREALSKLIKYLNLEAYVKLFGFKENPYVYIRNAKFLVLCSKHEGLPMVILESLALKTPVIAFNCVSGPSEMIVHKENGLLVEDQDFNELCKAIDYLIDNKFVIKEMEENTLKYFEPYLLKNQYLYWKPLL
ncbi:glycosyltransferase [Aestuariivivens insulae]|uniref:glycosyltransferase n=1 Tax=Aestuariivivens insulae TaxID=1621988 RepID=UPI001F59432E|nr:glycosyltransferase [Aestuariivivens insulae]